MKVKNANVFLPEGVFSVGDVAIERDRFTDDAGGETLDATGLYAIPGLVDVHFHGAVGYDFCDGSQEATEAIARYEAQHGVTAICPATMTYPEAKLDGVCKAAAAYRSPEDGAALVGINMEGPFISVEKKGAQNPEFVRAPSIDMFRRLQASANGLIKLLDIAPEEPGAMALIDAVADEVGISVAHTMADYDTAAEAFRRGARQATHLYNAMPPFTHRAPGVIGAAFDAPHCRVELICDGVHVHPAVVRATFQMFGSGRVVLISDSMMATGLPDGEYSLGGQAVTVRGNRATLHDGTIAGSATNLMDCLRSAVRKMNVPLEKAVKCASANPAKAIGVYGERGSIEPGKSADLVLLDEALNIRHVILRGRRIS